MFETRILCSAGRVLGIATVMTALAACGQRGPLYLPTDPAAAGRATLPEVLVPTTPTLPSPPLSDDVAPGGSGTGTASPVRNP